MNETTPYESASVKMWTKKGDRLTTVGDFLGRLPSLQILDAKRGEKILDAGCGAGFISRRLAREYGAIVYGCDRSQTMLSAAIEHQEHDPLGITYTIADISKGLPYEDGKFDAITCIAVLIHDSPKECMDFFKEAYRVLRPGGRIIVSIMHPDMFWPGIPTRTGRTSWVQYVSLESKPMEQSQRFAERYVDSENNVFESTVWYHPCSLFPRQLLEIGFKMKGVFHQPITRDILDRCGATGDIGYNAFYQVLAMK